MSDYPMLISNKLHSFRNFTVQSYEKKYKYQPVGLFFYQLQHNICFSET